MKASSLQKVALASSIVVTVSLIACAPDNNFRILPTQEQFNLVRTEERKVDLLWVVDNSISMEPSQEKLRKGFVAFARKYLRPNWDIRTAVVTTDMYIAHPSFKTYLDTTPPWRVAGGPTPRDDNPTYGPGYARLLPGMHDGPIVASCHEGNYTFLQGPANCRLRDAADAPRGVEKCISPAGNESSVSQCVNTTRNNSVHSGKAILSTLNNRSIDQLINDFLVNSAVGTTGLGSERAFSSLFQMIKDNESTETAFFRKDSFRIIVFLGDEDDQSMTISLNPPAEFSPLAPGEADFASTDPATRARVAASQYTNQCPEYNEGGHKYRLGVCPKSNLLLKEDYVKSELDSFFAKLDGVAVGARASYMVAPIVVIEPSTLARLHSGMNLNKVDHDKGRRFLNLVRLVGNGSTSMDIDKEDYSPILDRIGLAIVDRFGSFALKREPTDKEQIRVEVVHADGSRTPVSPSLWIHSGKVLSITDSQFLLSLKDSDQVVVSYQPKTAF